MFGSEGNFDFDAAKERKIARITYRRYVQNTGKTIVVVQAQAVLSSKTVRKKRRMFATKSR